ncbi:MAG: MBL fold metallo-hydrolase [archaeon]|jgi:glyoxylase-like metal-dependent hydrolase (beta-lactamase superfamily II)
MVKVIQINVGAFDNNFSYLVVGEGGYYKEAVLIDPTGNIDLIKKEITRLNLKVVLELFTHAHPDHCELKEDFEKDGVKSFCPNFAKLGETELLNAAGFNIKVIHTPGHTKESVCFLIENNLFTGDTLFVKGVGTTKYGGKDNELSDSLTFLSTLDKNITLWPGHDYGGASSTLETALSNSHLKPNEKMQEKIKKMVKDYEAKFANQKRF